MTARRRRRALLVALHGLRLLGQHYLTLLSAAVIAGLAFLALSSDAFQRSDRPADVPAILKEVPDGQDIGLQFTQSILWSPPQAELGLRSVVYFLYDDERQRVMMEIGLRDLSRARYKLDVGGPEDTNVFVRAGTPEEEAVATREIGRAQELARLQGYAFQVVDLRQN